MGIFILSGPIQSGKTTGLLKWCNEQKDIAGVLMPDINGSRKILNLKTKEIFDIECKNPITTKEPLTSVGRFHFYTAGFEKANSIVMKSLTQKHDWLVIDEAGKLELEGNGFYRSITKVVTLYSINNCSGNLLITVRDSLFDEIIAFFNIKDYQVINHLEKLG